MLRTAAAEVRAWRDRGHDTAVFANVSPRPFRHKNLVSCIAQVLAASALPESAFEIEVTKSTAMANAKTGRGAEAPAARGTQD